MFFCVEGRINSGRVWKKVFGSNYLNLYFVTMSRQSQPMFLENTTGVENFITDLQAKLECFPGDVLKV